MNEELNIETSGNGYHPTDTADIQARADRQEAALERFKSIYNQAHPYPQEPELNFWSEFGAEMGLYIVAALGSLVLVAMRTGMIFFLSALATANRYLADLMGLPPETMWIFAAIEMLAAILGIDGFLVVAGISRGRAKGQTDIPTWGIAAAFAISIGAGLGQGLGLIKDFKYQYTVEVALALAAGIGGSIVAYAAAEGLGAIWNRRDQMKSEMAMQHQADVIAWHASMEAEFYKRRKRFMGEAPARRPEAPPPVIPAEPQKTIREYLVNHGLTPWDIGREGRMTPKDLEEATGIDGNTLRPSLQRLREKGERWNV